MSRLTCIDSFWLNSQRTIASAPWRRLWATSWKLQRNFREFSEAFRCNDLGGRVMSQQPNHIYEFGSFHLDVAERMLMRDGEAIPLQLKAFDLLHVLVQHHGHLLEKDELLKVVWPDTIVEEVNLANNISVLRKALGEDGNGQRFIETVPRRGYRFVAGVRQIQHAWVEEEPPIATPVAEPPSPTTPPAAPEQSGQWRRLLRALAGREAAIIAIAALLLLAARSEERRVGNECR